jgi:TonB family protein
VEAAERKPPAEPRAAKSQFETITAQAMGPANRPPESGAGSVALAILDKPRPEYSGEGRVLKIEGEVVLEVLFTAAGEIRVLRVLHGLGHGLDETAATAAAAIRFRPAVEHGKPVDTVATVRIQFQLAD